MRIHDPHNACGYTLRARAPDWFDSDRALETPTEEAMQVTQQMIHFRRIRHLGIGCAGHILGYERNDLPAA